MKNRKRIVVLFLLLAVALVGVGYAALTTKLTIIGNAHIDLNEATSTFDERIYFASGTIKEVVCESGADGSKDEVSANNTDDATFTANSLAVKGDYIVFEFVIKNESNVAAKISIGETKLSGDVNPSNSNTDKFEVTYTYGNPDMTIASQGTMTVTVKVLVKAAVTQETSDTFGIELTATSIE